MFKAFTAWLRKFAAHLEELLIVFVVTVAGYTFLLAFFKMLWRLYRETQVGMTFQMNNDAVYTVINDLLNQNLFFFSLTISLAAVQICLVFALASHLSFLKKYFYDSRGFIGRIVCFGIPAAIITAFYMSRLYPTVYFAFCLLPTLALFGYCFKFIAYVVPAVDDIL